jgi:lysyl-tRNA synthetase class 2
VKQLNGRGVDNYPHKFHVSISLKDYIERYSHLAPSQRMEEEIVSVSGINFFPPIINKSIEGF